MDSKTLLLEQIERERTYVRGCSVGSEEYNASFERLIRLEEKMAEIEKSEAELNFRHEQMAEEKKDRFVKNIIEGVKVVGTGMVIPIVGLVAITAFEKNDTFTTALRGFVNCFIPKKV